MRYLGGKARWSRAIVEAMRPELASCSRFVDATCGAMNITVEADGPWYRTANDACTPLIDLYRAWRDGWRPPERIDEALYNEHRTLSGQGYSSPLTTFLGFACSYSGAWWNGWARPTKPRPKVPYGEVFADSAIRSLDRKLARCVNVEFTALDFRELFFAEGDVVYFDPEYRGTKRYSYFREPFPHDDLVTRCRDLANAGIAVFVSEYTAGAPEWGLVRTFTSGKRSSTAGRGIEHLWRVRS